MHAGSEPLLLYMLEVLMGALLPSEAMLAACRARYARTHDIAVLAPVVAALSKAEVLELLPGLLQVRITLLLGLLQVRITLLLGLLQVCITPLPGLLQVRIALLPGLLWVCIFTAARPAAGAHHTAARPAAGAHNTASGPAVGAYFHCCRACCRSA